MEMRRALDELGNKMWYDNKTFCGIATEWLVGEVGR